MTDRATVALTLTIAFGAWWGRAWVPLPIALTALALGAATTRPGARPWLLCVAAGLLASTLAARAWDGLAIDDAASAAASAGTWATLVTDPEAIPGGVQVDVRLAGKRLRSTTRDPITAASVAQRLAGERVYLKGSIRSLDPIARRRLASRHIAGRLEIRSISARRGGSLLARAANDLRRTLLRGARKMPAQRGALFAGVVLGDGREQDVAEVEDFRAAGLTHLLVVSGQNVAFALALVSPLLARLSLRGRVIAAACVLVVFGALTRWEPSVLRAVAMAFIAVVAASAGRPVASIRVLALAVSALLLVDPLLVRSIGFQLSAGASASIIVIAPALSRWMPAAIATTVAAQIGVAPVLLTVFDGMPLVSLTANLLAVPIAGPLMMWGIAAGLPAGLIGGPVARVLHLPTQLMLAWISGVARVAAALPIGWLTLGSAAVLVIGSASAALVAPRPHRARAIKLVTAVILVIVGALPIVAPRAITDGRLDTGGIMRADRLWRRDGHVVVRTDGRARPGRLLAALRLQQVTSIDVLVVEGRSKNAGRAVAVVLERVRVRLVLAPRDRQFGTAGVAVVSLRPGLLVSAGPIEIAATGSEGASRPDVRVQVASQRASRPRPP